MSIVAVQPADPPSRAELRKEFEAGNFKDAFEGFRRLLTNSADDSRQAGEDLSLACRALQQLGRLDELDDFREAAIRAHAKNWRLLGSAANSYMAFDHAGLLVAGKFHRGASGGQITAPGECQAVNATSRDRVRALQLLTAAMPHADADPARSDVANLYHELGHTLLSSRAFNGSWQLQSLTDLAELPDYTPLGFSDESMQGAPVDANDAPVFYPRRSIGPTPPTTASAGVGARASRRIRPGAVEYRPLGDSPVFPKPIRRGNVGRLSATFRCVRRTQGRQR